MQEWCCSLAKANTSTPVQGTTTFLTEVRKEGLLFSRNQEKILNRCRYSKAIMLLHLIKLTYTLNMNDTHILFHDMYTYI